MNGLRYLMVAIMAVAAIPAGAQTSGKTGVVASSFLNLTHEAKELYVAGITDALDEAGLLHCPPGTSYNQVITLAEAQIYRARAKANTTWAAAAVMAALKESGCAAKPGSKR